MPVSALSTAYSYDESAFDRLDAEYIADMEEMGFTVEKIKALSYWNKKVVNARSVQELETLLIEYKDLVEGTMVDISNSVDSFTSHSGGTLVLSYKGAINPISQVIYDKVVYLSADQTTTCYMALCSEDFCDYLLDAFIGEGVSIITRRIAADIAAAPGLSLKTVGWLIGFSISMLVWALQNVDKWNFEQAMEECTLEGKKVKIEFYHLCSATYPYYLNVEHCEPWNNSLIEPIEDYDYVWYEGVYDFNGDAIHQHVLTYDYAGNGMHNITCNTCSEVAKDSCDWICTENGNETHIKSCKNCCHEQTENCHLEYTNLTDTRHSVACTECDYSIASRPCQPVYTPGANGTHTVSCVLCQNQYTGQCNAIYESNGTGQHTRSCNKCNASTTESCDLQCTAISDSHHSVQCRKCDYSVSSAPCAFFYTSNGDGTHAKRCSVCLQEQAGTAGTCTYVYKSNGNNTHSQVCKDCGHLMLGPSPCMFKSDGKCRFCGAMRDSSVINSLEAEFGEE